MLHVFLVSIAVAVTAATARIGDTVLIKPRALSSLERQLDSQNDGPVVALTPKMAAAAARTTSARLLDSTLSSSVWGDVGASGATVAVLQRRGRQARDFGRGRTLVGHSARGPRRRGRTRSAVDGQLVPRAVRFRGRDKRRRDDRQARATATPSTRQRN